MVKPFFLKGDYFNINSVDDYNFAQYSIRKKRFDSCKVSLVIPAFNEENYIQTLLKCLKDQTFKDFEIIVADANSTDKTVQIAKDFGACVVQGGIPSVGRNNGAKIAKGDLLLFLDADIRFNNLFLQEVISEFYKRNLDIATCSISKDVNNKVAKTVYYIGGVNDQIRQYTKSPIGAGACLLVKKDIHKALNGFNTEKRIQEDWDYIQRAARKKYKYRIIKNDFYASTRRFDNNSIVKLAVGALIGFVVIGFGIKGIDLVTKMYGGLGETNKKRKSFRLFRQ